MIIFKESTKTLKINYHLTMKALKTKYDVKTIVRMFVNPTQFFCGKIWKSLFDFAASKKKLNIRLVFQRRHNKYPKDTA
jgi:hypothetical protein